MKKFKLSLLLGAVFSMSACNSNVKSIRGATLLREPGETTRSDYGEGYKAFREKLKVFSNKISESFINSNYEDGKNITISPLSLQMCLGLAVYASDGDTRKELLDAFDVNFSTFNNYYSELYKNYNFQRKSESDEDMFEIMMRNSIWIDDNVKLLDSGLDTLRDKAYCYSYETDFNSNKANEAIAKFIEIQSKGLLKPTLQFDTRTMFALINTLYLKDIWNDAGSNLEFSNDSKHVFTNSDRTKSSKKLLQGYYKNGKAISTNDYSSFYTTTNNGFKIYFIKPNDGKSVKEVFNKESMAYVLDRANYVYSDDDKKELYETRCIFPEYTADCDVDLSGMLMKDFNVKALFDSERCNFSNLCEETVFCNKLNQVAKLEVNKKGIEGAAVTYLAMCGSAGPGEYETIYDDFVVDKEFGFILTYDDCVLFSGAVTNIDKLIV